jgi:hypothetical protein
MELGSPEIPMTRLPPLLPTASALYFVAVRSGPAAVDGAGEPPDADAAGAEGLSAALEALGDVVAAGEHAANRMTHTATMLDRRFRM